MEPSCGLYELLTADHHFLGVISRHYFERLSSNEASGFDTN
jgi:hypothetical protein